MLKVMIPNLKLVMKKEYENMGTFLLKVTLKIVQNKFLLLKISKIQYHGDMLSNGDKSHVKRKGYDNFFNNWID